MTTRGALIAGWLALAGCDRVFGIGDPYEDARTQGSDAAVDAVMRIDAPADASEPLPDVLVHFDFDSFENSVDQTMASCSGCVLISSGGHSGGDVYLDGNACWSFPLSAMPSQYTIALWVKAQVTTQSTLFARAQSSTGNAQMWKLTGNSSAFEFDTLNATSNTEPLISGPGLTGAYTQLAVTYDGTTKHLYIDGVEKTFAQAMPLAVADTTAYLGCESDSTTARFNGYLDEVYIFDGALDAGQIANLHNL